MSISKYMAHAISIVFHPLLGISYAMLLMMKFNSYAFGSISFWQSLSKFDVVAIQIFITTAFLPAISVLLMRGLGMVSSFQMPDAKDRIAPYIATGVFYVWMYLNVRSIPQLPMDLSVFILGSTLALFAGFFVNNFSKISMHGLAAGGLLALTAMGLAVYHYDDFVLMAALLFVMLGSVGWARLTLGAHDPRDVYGGYLLGFAAQFASYWLLQLDIF